MFRALAKYMPRNIARFGAARDGATMVEFALIAPAFLAILFAIIETTLFLVRAGDFAGRRGRGGPPVHDRTSAKSRNDTKQIQNQYRLPDAVGAVHLQQRADRRGDVLIVQQRESLPRPRCMTSTARSSPPGSGTPARRVKSWWFSSFIPGRSSVSPSARFCPTPVMARPKSWASPLSWWSPIHDACASRASAPPTPISRIDARRRRHRIRDDFAGAGDAAARHLRRGHRARHLYESARDHLRARQHHQSI